MGLLSKLSFFSIFTDEEKEVLSKLSNHIYSYKVGESIVHQGDFDPSLYILIKGLIHITKNERPKVVLAKVKPGEIFGEIAFITQAARTANAIAGAPTIALKLDGKIFNKLTAEIQNKFRSRFIEVLINRLDNMNSQYIRGQA